MAAKWMGTAALISIFAMALLPAGRHATGHVGSSTDAAACGYSDPMVPCGATLRGGIPIGDGLFVTSLEDII